MAMPRSPCARTAVVFLAVTGAFGGFTGHVGEAAPEGARDAAAQPTGEVLQAIRLVLSPDAKEQARGELALKRMGAAIAPQLRYWIRKVRGEADRVRVVLEDLQGKSGSDPALESISADELFRRKVLECRALARKGEHRRAGELAEALLLLDRNSPFAWELRRLSRQSKERLVSSEVLEPGIETDKLVYEVGDRPEITFRLVNRRGSEVTIQLEKGVLGEIEVTSTIRLVNGGMKRETNKLHIQVPADVRRIVIAPEKTWEHRLGFDLKEELPLAGAVVRVQIAGRFRPTQWRVDGADDNLGLTLSETEFWIVPPGQGAQADRPLDKLTEALVFKKLEPFFVGGQLCVWAGENDSSFNEKLVETLLAHLDDLDPDRLTLASRFLNEATGQQLEAKPAAWKAWWARVKG